MTRFSAVGPRRSLSTSAMAAFLTRSTSLPNSPRASGKWHFAKPSVIPGFGLTLGLTVTYLTLIVLIPLAGLALESASLGLGQFWALATDERTLDALWTSFGSSLIAAGVNVVFGLIV